jgi:hypothetical protein
MVRRILMVLILAAVGAPLAAQVDWTAHGATYGTYNLSQVPFVTAPVTSTPQMWTSVIEDKDWIVTVWMELEVLPAPPAPAQRRVQFYWSALAKTTVGGNTAGTATARAQIGGSARNGFTDFVATGTATNDNNFYIYAPSITWTVAPASGGNAGFAMALPYADAATTTQLDVFVHFFVLDTAVTPNVWVEDPTRTPVNVDTSLGNSYHPSVVCIPSGSNAGDLVVVWRDQSGAGTIGGVPNINPQKDPAATGSLPSSDLFARRFHQMFSASATTPVPGMEDTDLINNSTINVSNSFSAEISLDACACPVGVSTDRIMVAWTSLGATPDNVGGMGNGTGPANGAWGGNAETSDTYIRAIQLQGLTGLTQPSSMIRNISISDGNSTYPVRIVWNPVLLQAGVLFSDNTETTGIGGSGTLNAVPVAQGTPAIDFFLATFGQNVTPLFGPVNMTASGYDETYAALAAIDAGGWFASYSSAINTAAISNYFIFFDASAVATTAQAYPTGVAATGQPQIKAWAVTTYKSTSAGILFTHSKGDPINRRTGQPVAGTTTALSTTIQQDAFLALGEITSLPGGANPLTVTVNSGEPIDAGVGYLNYVPAVTVPAQVECEVTVVNSNGLSPLVLEALNVVPPAGFKQTGALPLLPITIAPGSSQGFILNFLTEVPKMRSGQWNFEASATGTVNASPTIYTGKGNVAITGKDGQITADVAAALNPTVITTGKSSNLSLSVTVSNPGQFAISDMSVEGFMIAGFIPTDLSTIKALKDSLALGNVPSANVRTFTGSLKVGASVQPRTYRPAITLNLQQGTNTGSVTAILVNEVSFVAPVTTGTGPQSGLVNQGGGCAVVSEDGRSSAAWLVVICGLGVSAVLLALRMRRRSE